MTGIDVYHLIGTMLVNRKRYGEHEQETDELETIKNASSESLKEARTHLDSLSAQIREELEHRGDLDEQ